MAQLTSDLIVHLHPASYVGPNRIRSFNCSQHTKSWPNSPQMYSFTCAHYTKNGPTHLGLVVQLRQASTFGPNHLGLFSFNCTQHTKNGQTHLGFVHSTTADRVGGVRYELRRAALPRPVRALEDMCAAPKEMDQPRLLYLHAISSSLSCRTKENLQPPSDPPACHLFGCAFTCLVMMEGHPRHSKKWSTLSNLPTSHLFGAEARN